MAHSISGAQNIALGGENKRQQQLCEQHVARKHLAYAGVSWRSIEEMTKASLTAAAWRGIGKNNARGCVTW